MKIKSFISIFYKGFLSLFVLFFIKINRKYFFCVKSVV